MPEYFRIVRELTSKMGMPMPALYVTPSMQPNAFATGRNPEHAAVAVTQGILQVLDWDELRGVLAHELGHVGNRDILISSVAAAVATGITFIATMLRFAAIFGGGRGDDRGDNPIALLGMAILAPLAAGLLQASLSRNREFEADRSGAQLVGDGEPLARALLKLEAGAKAIPMDIDPAHAQAFIVNPLTGRRIHFANLFRTHPSTEDRVARLRGGAWQA
jgi:heat shock protein HtpX